MNVVVRRLAVLAVWVVPATHAPAAVELPGLFTSGAVLQRDRPVPVWGRAAPGEVVTVTLGEKRRQATAAADGRW
jgi:sialate O-acetylesterase